MFANLKKHPLQEGFTLIEIIVAVAILGLITVAFLPLLSNSISGIFSSGQRAEMLYQAQSKLETFSGTDAVGTVYKTNSNGSIEKTVTTQHGIAITNLDGGTVIGKFQKVTETHNGQSVSLYMFMPE